MDPRLHHERSHAHKPVKKVLIYATLLLQLGVRPQGTANSFYCVRLIWNAHETRKITKYHFLSPFYVTVKTFICKPTGKKYDTNTHKPFEKFFFPKSSVQFSSEDHFQSCKKHQISNLIWSERWPVWLARATETSCQTFHFLFKEIANGSWRAGEYVLAWSSLFNSL